MLGLTEGPLTPNEVIGAILRAPVDLLFFGGIGTYVRARSETDVQAGDRANDPVRITGREIRAKVVGEGANLAMTQRGRIEYAQAGGRINTDAIDNSAGVNSSDLEVNIKIALGAPMRTGNLTLEDRNLFLPTMTAQVAELCLRNNYLQSLCLSLAQRAGTSELPGHIGLMQVLEARGQLHRAIEFLPDEAALAERAAAGAGLTRPELSVLLAYAKNALAPDLLAAGAPDDPYLARELYRYFPALLADTYPDAVVNHRLRREVIATVLCNAIVNRAGFAFVAEAMAATSADATELARAYIAVRDCYGLMQLNELIDALDGKVKATVQLGLYAEVQGLLRSQMLWFLRNAPMDEPLAGTLERFAGPIAELRGMLPAILPPDAADAMAARATALENEGVPRTLAQRMAELPTLALAADIVLVAERNRSAISDAAEALFGVVETFGLDTLMQEGADLVLADRYDRMAFDRGFANLTRAQRDLAADIIGFGAGPIASRLAAWHAERSAVIDRTAAAVAGVTTGGLTVSKLSVAAGLLGDLSRA